MRAPPSSRSAVAVAAATGEVCKKKGEVQGAGRRGSVGRSMKRPLRLACLILAFAGGVSLSTGEMSAATKKKTKASHAVAKPSADPAVIREAQNALTELGFYFGAVDGELNEETQGALRRFQVYKGLGNSGAINEPTLEALRHASKEAASESRSSALSASVRPSATPPPAAAASESPPPPEKQPRKLDKLENPLASLPPLVHSPGATHGASEPPGASAALRPAPPPAVAPPPRQESAAARPEEGPYYPFLRGTPYAAMSLPEQEATLRSLQAALARQRFYHGPVDGAPTAATEEALYRFQSACGLPLSGRLDAPTLQALGLVSPHSPNRASASMARGRRGTVPPPRTTLPPPTALPPPQASQAPRQPTTLGPAGKMVVPRGARRPAQEQPLYQGSQGGRTLYQGGVVRGIPLED